MITAEYYSYFVRDVEMLAQSKYREFENIFKLNYTKM